MFLILEYCQVLVGSGGGDGGGGYVGKDGGGGGFVGGTCWVAIVAMSCFVVGFSMG